jgi:transaldolase / glucose-6-phosphate isomerase
MTRLAELLALGQSPWLDYIRRSLLTSGELKRLVEQDGITGVTINPTIFDKAIAGSHDYDDAIRDLVAAHPDLTPAQLYERLAVEDVTAAADVLRPVYDRTAGVDGYVSLEVAPGLAHDTVGTVAEARRLWREVARPNLLIKVPATPEGIPAIEQLIAEGINVNVTLMFSLAHYDAVAQAYRRGAARAQDPARLASVASVFVSRIDVAVDRELDALGSPEAARLRGTIAIANCRIIYARFRELFPPPTNPSKSPSARPQRVLWASTSTKDPRYRDTLYVEELVGPQTVDTIPPATLSAFEDHGRLRGTTLLEGLDAARDALAHLKELGVDLDKVTEALQVEGVQLFAESYDHLLRSLDEKRIALAAAAVDRATWSLGTQQSLVDVRLATWETAQFGARFWRLDSALWPAAPPAEVPDRLGWLHLPESMHDALPRLLDLARQVRANGIRHVVVLGMGGSSLAPYVFGALFGGRADAPELLVLDSTHPDEVRAMRERLDLLHSLFIVSSKSGTTLEPNSFYHYFVDALRTAGAEPGPHFVAITDPGTPLDKLTQTDGFLATVRALPTVGGRYSALTDFGLVPAALAGVDVRTLLDRAWTMSEACAASVPVAQNPGLVLGAVVGELAAHGRDKLTFYASPRFAPFPDWVEQLVAESTGKIGKGIVPIVGEPWTAPQNYGADRLFVEIQEGATPDASLAAHTARLEAAGFPVIRIRLPGAIEVGEEFFRWEMAVASAGAIIGIDPFDQPDVELAKELARQAMAAPSGPGGAPDVPTVSVDDPTALGGAARAWRDSARAGDYIGLQAYLAPTRETTAALTRLRAGLLERTHVATTLGYGPRFLHSTGQLHKGGPNTGLFLQIVDAPTVDVPVPGMGYTFGTVIQAQSVGDYRALRQKGRRILRVDVGADVLRGLARLDEALRG